MRSKMDFSMENCTQPMDLSLGGGDSNALILSTKRKNKRKRTNQECEKLNSRKAPKISKSQQRKRKKLAEEKDKSVSISKSIEALEIYKLPDSAYSLLQSSRNIGKVESKKEKRRKAVLFSKAGFEIPSTDQQLNKADSDHACSESELELEKTQSRRDLGKNDQVEPKIVRKEIQKSTYISSNLSQGLVCSKGHCFNGGINASPPYKNAVSNKHDMFLQEDINSKIMKMDKLKETPKVNISRESKLSNFPASRALIGPTVVHVSRPEDVQKAREDLPIVMMEQEITEAINDHPLLLYVEKLDVVKPPKFLSFFWKLAMVQVAVVFEVV